MNSEHLPDPIIEHLNQSIQKVIQKQIADNEPPEINIAIKKLEKNGYSHKKISSMLAKLVVKHFHTLIDKKFSYQNYKEDLKKLFHLKPKNE